MYRIILCAAFPNAEGVDQKFNISVTADELTTTDRGGEKTVFRRIKN
jgi:hypothetical protein